MEALQMLLWGLFFWFVNTWLLEKTNYTGWTFVLLLAGLTIISELMYFLK